jgi:predicted nucleic acid-binding protein
MSYGSSGTAVTNVRRPTVYLDTSIALRVLLGQRPRLGIWGKWDRAYSSDLLGLEARRVVDRLRLESILDDAGVVAAQEGIAKIEVALGRVALTRAVLRRAAMPMATSVKTLDALHLASALLLRERRGSPVLFVTHDAQQAIAARALGFECEGA